MGHPSLITQTGNFAGTTALLDLPSPQSTPPSKKIRLLLSLVSNPGNSGGPILNDKGKLIGLLEGNLNAPMRDTSGAQIMYTRPKVGAPPDATGQPQFEEVPFLQNAGISIVVPARLVMQLGKEAESSTAK